MTAGCLASARSRPPTTWIPLPRSRSIVSSSASAPQSIAWLPAIEATLNPQSLMTEAMRGGSRPYAPPARARPQLATLRIGAFDLSEADVGARQRVAHQLAIPLHWLMDRADVTASQQYYLI